MYRGKISENGGIFTAMLNMDTFAPARSLPLEMIYFLGVKNKPQRMVLNGNPLSFYYDAEKHLLKVEMMGAFVAQNITIKWSI